MEGRQCRISLHTRTMKRDADARAYQPMRGLQKNRLDSGFFAKKKGKEKMKKCKDANLSSRPSPCKW